MDDEVKEILEKSFGFDAHSDMLNDVVVKREKGEKRVIETRHLGNLQEGGLKGQIFSIFVEVRYRPERALKRGLQLLDAMHLELQESSSLQLCLESSDFDKARQAKKFAALIGMEGIEPLEAISIEESLALLRTFYRQGVRCIGLTWQLRNMAGDGAEEERTKGGLSRLGMELVREMERMQIVIDLAHLSEAGFFDVLRLVKKPVICSHAACRSLVDRSRNLTDEQIKALAENGGVVGVMAFPTMIDPVNPTVERVLDHIEHIINIAGINHVGFGADFSDYIEWSAEEAGDEYVKKRPTTKGLEDVTKLPNLVKGMIDRGYSMQDVRKFLGDNFLRVFDDVL
jgi:membrane dipeptidase